MEKINRAKRCVPLNFREMTNEIEIQRRIHTFGVVAELVNLLKIKNYDTIIKG